MKMVGLFTYNNETGTPSVKSVNENTSENAESTRRYPFRKTSPPFYLADYVKKSESKDLVNHVVVCYALIVLNLFGETRERDDNLNWKYTIGKILNLYRKCVLCYRITRG